MKHVSGNLYRGPRPENLRDLKDLRDLGVQQIICLQSGVHEVFHDDEYEKYAGTLGLHILKIPCSDFTPPTEKQVDEFFYNVVESGLKTYVHCLHGVDRTGFMCAAYRMSFDEWPLSKAIGEMFDNGFHKMPYLWWTYALTKYVK